MVPECCFGADTIKLIKKALGCNRMPRAKLGTEPRENGGISPFLGRLRSHVKGSKEANGARGRSRTADTVIFSHVLYQLSYPGIAVAAALVKGPARVGSAPMAKGLSVVQPLDT